MMTEPHRGMILDVTPFDAAPDKDFLERLNHPVLISIRSVFSFGGAAPSVVAMLQPTATEIGAAFSRGNFCGEIEPLTESRTLPFWETSAEARAAASSTTARVRARAILTMRVLFIELSSAACDAGARGAGGA